MLLALVIIVVLAILILLFFRIARACVWPIGDALVARHERKLAQLRSRQPWE